MPLLSSYLCDHAASLRISDLSTMFKCFLASGKKSIEQLFPIDPQQTSVPVCYSAYFLHIIVYSTMEC